MSKTTPTIRSVKARAVVAPISRPVKNAFGVIEAAPLVLIDVVTDQGVTGHSYIFAYTKLTLTPLVRPDRRDRPRFDRKGNRAV